MRGKKGKLSTRNDRYRNEKGCTEGLKSFYEKSVICGLKEIETLTKVVPDQMRSILTFERRELSPDPGNKLNIFKHS